MRKWAGSHLLPYLAVFRIRSRQFWGLPDPRVRGTVPDSDFGSFFHLAKIVRKHVKKQLFFAGVLIRIRSIEIDHNSQIT
jgi:hypothetical protein